MIEVGAEAQLLTTELVAQASVVAPVTGHAETQTVCQRVVFNYWLK